MSEQHEDARLDATPVNRILAAAMVVLLLVITLCYGSWRKLFGDVPEPSALPPQPRLQAHATEDLARFRAGQQAQLERYGWIDQPGGVARIPVDRAMALLAARGGRLGPASGRRPP